MNQSDTPSPKLREPAALHPDALETTARETLPLLRGLARNNFYKYGYPADEATCEDICSQIWQQLLENNQALLRTCLKENRLPPMLHTLARNRCIDHIRKFRKVSLTETELPVDSNLPTPDPAPGLRSHWLRGHIRTLPGREREVIELFYLQDLSYREIHQVSGIPENSIGPTLKRGLKRLRERIESEENHAK